MTSARICYMLCGAAGLSAPKLTILRMSSDRIHLYTDIERWKHYSNKYNNKKKLILTATVREIKEKPRKCWQISIQSLQRKWQELIHGFCSSFHSFALVLISFTWYYTVFKPVFKQKIQPIRLGNSSFWVTRWFWREQRFFVSPMASGQEQWDWFWHSFAI